ncbi:MAG TPA: hypothetical protein VLP43_10575 [Solirubrobacteraceae bacterium]|nr:hypothetical protein [Solirubrobacteraceae bacterium]
MKANRERPGVGLLIVRYGLGAVMVIAGLVLVVINPGGFGVDGFALAVGGGLSVLLINYLFRLGVSSNLDREQEEAARRYLEEHGVWPDEERPSGRRWTLPYGAVTPDQEASREDAAAAPGEPNRD